MSIAGAPASFGPPGLYGKLPSQGDFVTRRLPQEFIQPWDDWLQSGMSASRSALGAGWFEAYQNAPIWRFVLGPGACGPWAWAGVLQPSVDRVGRYFPLTVAVRLPDDVDPFLTLLQCSAWHGLLEQAAFSAMDPATTIEEFDQRIERIAFPPDAALAASASEDTLPIAENSPNALCMALEPTDSPQKLQELLSRHASRPEIGAWLTRGTPEVGPTALISKSIPSAMQFCSLLAGRWEEFGWESLKRIQPVSADEETLPGLRERQMRI